MQDFPQMSGRQACIQRVKYFTAKQACKVCGDKRRRLDAWSETYVACMTCEPEILDKPVSKCNIEAQVNKHNKAVKKQEFKLFAIPRTFGGMNTNTR